MDKEKQLKELQNIPGVGKIIANDFWNIGIKHISDLRGEDPEKLYFKISNHKKHQVDRCVLYVCREAVYYANNKKHDPKKLKWWYWKDKIL